MTMRITVLTHTGEVHGLEQLISALAGTLGVSHDCRFYETYDDFIREFPREASQAVIIARRGADGMECARNARLMRPTVPLVWLSDDAGFGIESYRLGCAFFSAEPISEALLSTALERCRVKGDN